MQVYHYFCDKRQGDLVDPGLTLPALAGARRRHGAVQCRGDPSEEGLVKIINRKLATLLAQSPI